MLFKGQSKRAYNVGSEDALSIADVAREVAVAMPREIDFSVAGVATPGTRGASLCAQHCPSASGTWTPRRGASGRSDPPDLCLAFPNHIVENRTFQGETSCKRRPCIVPQSPGSSLNRSLIATVALAGPLESPSAIRSDSSSQRAIRFPPNTTSSSAGAAASSMQIPLQPRAITTASIVSGRNMTTPRPRLAAAFRLTMHAPRPHRFRYRPIAAVASRQHSRCRMRYRGIVNRLARPGIHRSSRTRSFAALRGRVPRTWL